MTSSAPLQTQRQNHIFFAAVVSLLVSVALMAVKFYAFNRTGSQAIYSDAMESIVNVIAALLALVVVKVASKPADRDHPYGHGKVEYFSAAFEGGLIAFAALMIVVSSVQFLLQGKMPSDLGAGVLLSVVTGLGNLGLGIYLQWVGKKQNSMALIASGKHVVSDFATTAGVVVGLVLVEMTGFSFFDPAVAIITALGLAWTGYKLVRKSIGGLLDEEDREAVLDLLRIIEQERDPAIIQVHHCRVMRAGHYHHIDAHAVMPEFWDVSRAHDHVQSFETRIIREYGADGELHLHVDPCRRAYCESCDLNDCPIRAKPFKSRAPLTLEEFTDPEEPEDYR